MEADDGGMEVHVREERGGRRQWRDGGSCKRGERWKETMEGWR